MKLSKRMEDALRDPDAEPVPIEMTEERKERLVRICDGLYDWLKEHCEGPLEAYMAICFVRTTFEETYHFKGDVMLTKEGEAEH